mmetsp:Transcript_10433/g.19067  ORF Transcript_10433/g.19067 Transcript_10433/m.19067 type:complete len:415 (+) Transcript_10433:1623-2867(+)
MSPDDNFDVTVVPIGQQFFADGLKPRRFFFQTFRLDIGNIGIRQQRLVVVYQPRLYDGFLCGNERHLTSPHSCIVPLQQLQLSHVGRLTKIKGLHVIDNIGSSLVVHVFLGFVAIIITVVVVMTLVFFFVHSYPLKLEIVDTDGTTPSARFFRFVRQLNIPHDLMDGQLESYPLSRHDVGWARHEDALSIGHEGKGLIGPYSCGDRHLEDLCGRCRHGFFSWRCGRYDPYPHVGPRVGRTRHHEPLSRVWYIDGELHSGINVGWDGDQKGLCGPSRFCGRLIDLSNFGGHGDGSSSGGGSIRFGTGERCHFEQLVVCGRLGRQRDLQRMSRSRCGRTPNSNSSGSGMDGELCSRPHSRWNRNAIDLSRSSSSSSYRICTWTTRAGRASRSCGRRSRRVCRCVGIAAGTAVGSRS